MDFSRLWKKPIIIISAARSGTKILRYVLSASNEMAGCPYDANYVWKYGNYSVNHDELDPDSVDEIKKERIRNFFLQICRKESRKRLIEKSVPNSLRIPFVRSIFPNCKIIHLYRNGLDVAASSRLCWQDSVSSERIQSKEDRIRKIKEFPISMAWPYLLGYLKNYGKKILLRQEHVGSWGPRYKGIDQDVKNKSLIEVCAIQWVRSVEHCCIELEKLKNGSEYINVSYEKLVSDPVKQLERIIDFIKLVDGENIITRGKRVIKHEYVQNWKDYLTDYEYEKISVILNKPQRVLDELK